MIFSKFRIDRSGFTLMELVLFTALFGIITTSFIAIFVSVTRIQSQQGVTIGVNQESRFLMDTVQRYVRESSLIEIPGTASSTTSTLKLRMASSSIDPVLIQFVSSTGQVFISIASGTQEPLTSNKVKISSLSFVKRSNPNSKDVVEFSFTMASTLSTSSPNYVSRNFNTAIARVTSAVFDTDIEPSSQPLVVGQTSTLRFSGINNTIFFGQDIGIWRTTTAALGLDVFLGISPYRFTPRERLHINEGGIGFNPGTVSRPACSSATTTAHGMLWFESSTIDTMALCMRLDASTYFWTGDYPAFQAPVLVDSEDISGDYSDIDAVDVGTGTTTSAVFMSYYKNRGGTGKGIWFASSSNSGNSWGPAIIIHETTTNNGIGHDGSITAPTTSTIYVSYFNQNSGGLWFSKSTNGGTAGSWNSMLVPGTDTGLNVGQYTSIISPTTSTIYISYFEGGGPYDLKLAYSLDGGVNWNIRTIDSAGNVGKYASIDSIGTSTIFISYYVQNGQKLGFARIDNGPTGLVTTSTIFDSYSDVGKSNDIEAISTSTILASFYDGGSNSLKFARSDNGGGSWSAPVTVDYANRAGENNSIASINGNRIYISYWLPNSGLWLAASYDGGVSWPTSQKQGLDLSHSNAGEQNSITVTPRGNYFVSYKQNQSSVQDAYATRFVNRPLFKY